MNSTEIATKLAPLTSRRSTLSERLAVLATDITATEQRRIELTSAGSAVPQKLNDQLRTLRDEEASVAGAIAQLTSEVADLEAQLQRAQLAEAVSSARERLESATAAAHLAKARRRERLRQFIAELRLLEGSVDTAQVAGRAAAAALRALAGTDPAFAVTFAVDQYSDAAEANFVQTLLSYGAAEWVRVGQQT